MRTYHVMFNASSGASGVDEAALREHFGSLGAEFTIDADQSVPFKKRLDRARNSKADVLVAAGGDGTATALAEIAVATGRPLAVVPLGTANLLARDLSLPLDFQTWFSGLPEFVERRIDVGRVNGTLFLHKVVIGFVPSIAAAREKIRGNSRAGARLAFIGYAIRRIVRARRIALEVTQDDGQPHIDRLQAVAVANNAYDEAFGHVFSRARLDAGSLSVYKLTRLTLLETFRLATGVLIGRWRDSAALDIATAESVVIRSRRKRMKVMRDGEVESMFTPLNFTIEKQALIVLAPPVVEAAAETATDVTEAPDIGAAAVA